MNKRIVQVDEKLPILEGLPLSFQHLFAMFGASVLVPFLFKIDPGIVLLMNGVGTLLYLMLCKFRIPAFLGSSFAFLSPVFAVLAATKDFRVAQWGFVASGLLFIFTALIIKFAGNKWVDVVFPPAAMGAIVAVIGLELAPVAAKMAGLVLDDPSKAMDIRMVIVSMSTLAIIILGSVLFRGFLSIIPILIGVVAGYIISIFFGIVDFGAIDKAPLFALPNFGLPAAVDSSVIITTVITILPAAIVVIVEHIGHLVVTGNIVEKNLVKDPGLHRSLMGDGISTLLSGIFGSVPTTTYGENIGVLAITKVYSTYVIAGAAVISIIIAFFGKFAAAIMTIPTAVMGGVSLLLFGVIAASGIRMLVESKVDYSKPKNLILTSVVLVIGISGAKFYMLTGMTLATIISVVVSLVFAILEKCKIMND